MRLDLYHYHTAVTTNRSIHLAYKDTPSNLSAKGSFQEEPRGVPPVSRLLCHSWNAGFCTNNLQIYHYRHIWSFPDCLGYHLLLEHQRHVSSKRNDPLHAGLKTRIEPSPDEQSEPSFHNTLLSNILLSSSQLNDYLTRTVVNNFPIKIDTLDTLLTTHPNRVKVNYVVRGLRDGFRIGFNMVLNQIIYDYGQQNQTAGRHSDIPKLQIST